MYSHQITQLAPDALSPQKPPFLQATASHITLYPTRSTVPSRSVAALPPNHALEPFMLEHEDIVGQTVNFPHKERKEISSPWAGTGLAAG